MSELRAAVTPVDPSNPAAGVEIDPWLDNDFAPLQLGGNKMVDDLVNLANEHPEFAPSPENELPEASLQRNPAHEVATPVPAVPAKTEPETVEYEDGSKLVIEQTNKGWVGTLLQVDKSIRPEVFKGATKNEMFANIAYGKINATRKIREFTRREKLRAETPAAPTPAATPVATPTGKVLTADEVFQLKTDLQANPDLAFEKWFQSKTGMSLGQLVSLAGEGRKARQELSAEAVAKEFMESNPDYYRDPEGKNFETIVAYIAKTYVGKTANKKNFDSLYDEIVGGGHWTPEKVQEAFDELKQDGLLELAPEEVETPAPAPPAPPAAPERPPANPRIVGMRTRPRANLGIREGETTGTPPTPAQLPSDEGLESLSNADIQKLWNDTRRYAAQHGLPARR